MIYLHQVVFCQYQGLLLSFVIRMDPEYLYSMANLAPELIIDSIQYHMYKVSQLWQVEHYFSPMCYSGFLLLSSVFFPGPLEFHFTYL